MWEETQQHTCINASLFISKVTPPINPTLQFPFPPLQQVHRQFAITTNKKKTSQQLGICPVALPPSPIHPETGHSSSVRRTIRKAAPALFFKSTSARARTMNQAPVSCIPNAARMSKAKKVLEEAREIQNPELDLSDKGVATFEEMPGLCKWHVAVALLNLVCCRTGRGSRWAGRGQETNEMRGWVYTAKCQI